MLFQNISEIPSSVEQKIIYFEEWVTKQLTAPIDFHLSIGRGRRKKILWSTVWLPSFF